MAVQRRTVLNLWQPFYKCSEMTILQDLHPLTTKLRSSEFLLWFAENLFPHAKEGPVDLATSLPKPDVGVTSLSLIYLSPSVDADVGWRTGRQN